MNRKWLSVILAIVMVFGMGTVAFASSVTNDDIVVPLDEAVAEGIVGFLNANPGSSIVDYFGDDLVAAVENLLSGTGIDAKDLVLDEVVPFSVTGLSDDELKAGVEIPTTADMNPGDTKIVLAGFADGKGGVIWYAVKTKVGADGKLMVKFTDKMVEASKLYPTDPPSFAVLGAK